VYPFAMARLKSELEVTCPCCQAVLVVDTNLGRVVEHRDPPNPDRPELSDAQRILADAEARRNALFEQSVQEHKTRGDALSKRFEEALKEAKKEPISKPLRGFDLD
jgi:hypothetical protein